MRISDWSSDVCSSALAVLPERIDLGYVEDVDRARLKAQEIGDDLHPVDQRTGIPVDVPARVVLARPADRRRAFDRTETDIEAGIELHSAQIDEAPGLHADIGKPDRLPEAHGDPGAQPAEAERQIRVVRIGPDREPDLELADRKTKKART